jgi:hypothetical protein
LITAAAECDGQGIHMPAQLAARLTATECERLAAMRTGPAIAVSVGAAPLPPHRGAWV